MTAPARGPVVRASIAWPTAMLSIVGVVLAWLGMVIIDPRAEDGAGPMLALFGIPLVVSAIVVQLMTDAAAPDRRISRSFLWWLLGVLPVGVLSTLAFAVPRHIDYFIGDESPWMLVWIGVFVYCAMLLGAVAWFFFVFPAVMVFRNVVAAVRGTQTWGSVVTPLPMIALGAMAIVGGLAISIDLPGRFGWPAVVAALLGLPGGYDLQWPAGLWIARALLLFVLLVWVGAPWLAKRRARASAPAEG